MTRDRARGAVAVVAGLAAAWIAFDLLVWAYGESPRELARLLFVGTWGTSYGIGQVLFKATPLLFAGLAVELALRAGLFNIGGEGQITVGSLAAGIVGAKLAPTMSPWVGVPITLAVAMAAGAFWAWIPGILRAMLGVHEVITTIMLNRLADGLVGLAFAIGFAEPGTVRTPPLGHGARIPRLEAWLHVFAGSAVSFAVLVGIAAAIVVSWWQRRSRVGIELGQIGKNPEACEAERIPVKRRLAQAMALSGGVAALAVSSTVLGFKGYYESGIGAGAGFGGIAVALLGRGSAVGIVLAALLFGTLAQGGLALNAHVPREMMDLIEGVVILTVAFADARVRSALVRSVKPAEPAQAPVPSTRAPV
ncbi:MAG TPA: ABC transporter permease [Polyangiaceae bacterium]